MADWVMLEKDVVNLSLATQILIDPGHSIYIQLVGQDDSFVCDDTNTNRLSLATALGISSVAFPGEASDK